MNEYEILEEIRCRLSAYGAVMCEYQGKNFVGIKNPYSDNDMAILLNGEEVVLEFATQTAHFEQDIDYIVKYAESFLTDELSAVEVFLGDKALFGGARRTMTCNFSTIDTILECYCGDNAEAIENVKLFFKKNRCNIRCYSWSGKFDNKVEIIFNDGNFVIE